MDKEEELVTKTAWYYYVENMTQQEISKLLGISRARAIKLLDKARKTGVIQFKIREDSAQRMTLEKEVCTRFQLKDAFIVPSISGDHVSNHHAANNNIARAAATYISSRISENSVINMGYGDTPSLVLSHLSVMIDRPITCVSLTGGVNYYLPYTEFNLSNMKLFLMPTPLLVSTKEMANALRAESSVEEISRMVSLSSMSVVGIGSMCDKATILTSGILSKNDFTYLGMQGAVGDILSHFIDKEGNLLDCTVEDRLLSTPLEQLKSMENVVGVATGSHKVPAIRAVLEGQYIDVLITEESTARELLDYTPDP